MNTSEWSQLYNLADIVRFNLAKGLDFNKDTIAYQYVSQMNGPFPVTLRDIQAKTYKMPSVNFELLYEIVNKREVTPVPNDTFVVHVRAGDCIDIYGSNFPPPERFIEIIKKHNLHQEYKKCVLVTGSHNNHSILESNKYIKNLKSRIEELNLNCDLMSTTVDDDFALLATSQCFLLGLRGFSWLAGSINPNRTIWDIQEPPHFPWLINPRFKNQLIKGYEFIKGFKC